MDSYVEIYPLFVYEVYFMINLSISYFWVKGQTVQFLLDLSNYLVFTEECFIKTYIFISYLESWYCQLLENKYIFIKDIQIFIRHFQARVLTVYISKAK